jgi:hypothetical protein
MLSQIIRAFFLVFPDPVRLLTAMLLATLIVGTSATAQTPAIPSTPAPAAPAIPAPPPVSLSALVDQTLAAFPRVEADVVDVQGATLTLSAGARSGAQGGLALQVFREGKEIRHPRSGQLLGKTEQPLGRAVITRVFDGYSLALYEGEQAKVGDSVRTPTGKVKLMLLPLSGTAVRDNLAEAVSNEIYEGLTRTGRFQVVLGDPLVAWLLQERITPEEFLKGNGVAAAFERFKPDNILALQFTRIEKKPYLEVRLFSGGRPTPAFSTALFVPSSIKAVQPGRFSASDRGSAPTPEVKKRSLLARLLGGELDKGTYSSAENSIPLKEVARLGFVVAGMDVAVAPADQIPRLAVTDGERVSVYRVVNRALEPDWSYHERAMGKIFSVQFLDTGDGVLSVVANRYDPRAGMTSFIVAARAAKPVVLVNNVDAILLAVDEKGRGVKQTLWSQSHNKDTFFGRQQVDQMVVRNGALVRERAVPVPETFRATGATLSHLVSKTSPSLVFIDEQNRLRIANGSEEIWRSSSAVGSGLPRIEVERLIERGGRSYYHQIEPIPLSVDLDGDGVPEVIVPQNQLQGGYLGVVYRGPAGLRFQQVSSGFEGVVTALGAIPPEDGGAPVLIAAVVQYASFLKRSGETQIIMTTPE